MPLLREAPGKPFFHVFISSHFLLLNKSSNKSRRLFIKCTHVGKLRVPASKLLVNIRIISITCAFFSREWSQNAKYRCSKYLALLLNGRVHFLSGALSSSVLIFSCRHLFARVRGKQTTWCGHCGRIHNSRDSLSTAEQPVVCCSLFE